MTIHTTVSLFNALQRIITNLPRHATSIDIHLRAREMPTMDATQELLVDGHPVVEDGAIKTEDCRFVIVPESVMAAAIGLAESHHAKMTRGEEPDPRVQSLVHELARAGVPWT